MDNHTEIQLEFTRKALRFFYDDIPQDEYDGSEDDLREYAATINEGFGYNLDAQLAALTAERDALRAEVELLRADNAELDSKVLRDCRRRLGLSPSGTGRAL